MPYTLQLHVHAACRSTNNDPPTPLLAAAAVVSKNIYHNYTISSYRLPPALALTLTPNNQRAHLVAALAALSLAATRAASLRVQSTPVAISIHTPSRYVVDCVTVHWHKWSRNGWRSCQGTEVKDRDLLEMMLGFVRKLESGAGRGGVGEVGERTVQWVLVLGGGGDVDAVARAEVAGVLDEMEGEE